MSCIRDLCRRDPRWRAAGLIEALVVIVIMLIVVLLMLEMTRKPDAVSAPAAKPALKTGSEPGEQANTPSVAP